MSSFDEQEAHKHCSEGAATIQCTDDKVLSHAIVMQK